MGSTGAGVCIEQGVTTTVSLRKRLRPRVSVSLNGHQLKDPVVSRMVVGEYLGREGRLGELQVDHRCPLPVGSGYGTSGAAAASLSLALNDTFGGVLSRNAALAVAHRAEVRAKTGLGTVMATSKGGLTIRIRPGAPGVGEARKLILPGSLRIVSGSFGPIPTVNVLSSHRLRRRVNLCSKRLVENLLRNPDEKNFVRLSRRFADCLGLVSSRLRRVLDLTDRQGVVASMMMLGNGAFCLVPPDKAWGTAKLMHRGGLSAIISRIYPKGTHLT